jgi:hypothetical protein
MNVFWKHFKFIFIAFYILELPTILFCKEYFPDLEVNFPSDLSAKPEKLMLYKIFLNWASVLNKIVNFT